VDAEGGAAAVDALRARGLQAEFVRADVADREQVRHAVELAASRWGRLDFIMNNAGVTGRMAAVQDLDDDDLERVLAVNLKGPFYVCKYGVPAQIAGGGGSILNVSSITAMTGSAYFAAYSAAKAGVIALTRSLARNLGRRNIRVNCLAPGSVAGTRLMRDAEATRSRDVRRQELAALMRDIPTGRTGAPEDIAQYALFLASPLARHIHGAVLQIDGGELLGFQ
jgi:NAD(P)-dependent dehydrogenase (short-subunit alcohol dehydrogenase family)